VLVPYPHHADRQQYENAEALATAGGAIVVEEKDLTAEVVRERVVGLLLDAGQLERMSASMGALATDGAERIAADVEAQCRRRRTYWPEP
jgi:UDP-N-acetylglucosamine--N-acetylmuramyl-(pentapeptide) pyrophosphoryl-undecaprenol N-acetylglucosamine transferase